MECPSDCAIINKFVVFDLCKKILEDVINTSDNNLC